MVHKPNSALVVIGHGSTVNPDSDVPTFAHAAEIRRRRSFGEVTCAFWKEEPSLRQVLHTIDSAEIYLVPNFVSEGYFTRHVIPRELELTGPVTEREGRTLKYCDPVGSHPQMTDVLLRRARETAPGIPAGDTSLIIVGHGTSLNENSGAAVKEQVEAISKLGIYGEVLGAFMEEMPFVTDWRTLTRLPNVVAVPFFISDGEHSYQDIPVLLGIETEITEAASRREIFRHNPYHIGGRRLYYASAIGTEPFFADIILEQVLAFDEKHATAFA